MVTIHSSVLCVCVFFLMMKLHFYSSQVPWLSPLVVAISNTRFRLRVIKLPYAIQTVPGRFKENNLSKYNVRIIECSNCEMFV